MTISLDRLPFDILFNITGGLRFDDIINLSLTCRQLNLLLNESTLCRRTIEVCENQNKCQDYRSILPLVTGTFPSQQRSTVSPGPENHIFRSTTKRVRPSGGILQRLPFLGSHRWSRMCVHLQAGYPLHFDGHHHPRFRGTLLLRDI